MNDAAARYPLFSVLQISNQKIRLAPQIVSFQITGPCRNVIRQIILRADSVRVHP